MTKNLIFFELLEKVDPIEIIEALKPHLTKARKERIEPILDNRLHTIHVAIENPTDIHNALAIVRTSEAFGIMHLHLIGKPRKKKGKQTMQGADKWVEIHYYTDLGKFLNYMKRENLLLYGATPKGHTTLSKLPINQPFCLFFGNEMLGLTDDALESCDETYQIPMYGLSESFNLSVSAAISLYDVTSRKRGTLQAAGDLSQKQQLEEKALFYFKTIGTDKAQKILNLENAVENDL